jgi:hypothetical protein
MTQSSRLSRTLTSPRAHSTARERLGVRCTVQRQHRFRARLILPGFYICRELHKAALHAALQGAGAHNEDEDSAVNRGHSSIAHPRRQAECLSYIG